MTFRWIRWNLDHIAGHGVTVAEAEDLVNFPVRPYPARIGGGKYQVRGKTPGGDYLQVIYIFSPENVVFVIHARPLSANERRNFRRRRT
jgi:uncharacterized DUF497 family protein